MGEKSGCSTCSRIFLSFLNIAMLLAGLCVIGLSLWLWFDKTFEEQIRNNILAEYSNNAEMNNVKKDIRLSITVSFWVLCGTGLAAALIGFIGTCGALCGSRCVTGFYLALIIILVLAEVAVGVFILLKKNTEPSVSGLHLFQPTCTAAVWDRLDFSFMIAGFVLIGIVALQILAVILAISIIVTVTSRS
ncbi:unnamed protein product [Enterobius vermicularis]|uniref:Tetraspanin n=1 Tax=Enterobius vermicularis TaxID=51028 RepID=A0A0N4VN32_ENTVE|nr:unnamed protein product [Enterobius vermicularis]